MAMVTQAAYAFTVLLIYLPATVPAAALPLDPLSGDEIAKTVELLRAAGHVDDATRFPSITLKEPPKATVLAWQPGMAIGRAPRRIAQRYL